jgi:hypothetical protein
MNKKRLLERNAVVVNAMTYFTSILKAKNNDYLQLSFKDNKLDIINGYICLRLDLGNYDNGLLVDYVVKPMLFKAGIALELKDGYNFRKNKQGLKETNIQDNFNYDMFNVAYNLLDKAFLTSFTLSNLILIKDKENVRILKPTLETDINKGKVLLIKQRFLENTSLLSDYNFSSIEKSSIDDNMENCYKKPLLIQNESETVKIIIAPLLHAGKIG